MTHSPTLQEYPFGIVFIFMFIFMLTVTIYCAIPFTAMWQFGSWGCPQTLSERPDPEDCATLCDALGIQIPFSVESFGLRTWEVGTCQLGVGHL